MWLKVKAFLFYNRTTKQTLAKNTFWLAVSNFGGRIIRAFIVIYAARVLGAVGWGAFSYAVTLAAFLTIFTDFGINSLLTREASKEIDPQTRARLLSTTFILKLVSVLIGVLIVIFFAPYLITLKEALPILPIVAFVLLFDTLRDFAFSVTRSLEKMEWEAASFIFTNVAILVFGLIFLKLDPTVSSFTFAYAAGSAAGTVVTFWAIRKHLGQLLRGFTKSLVRPILVSAWPFALSGILGALMVNTDVLIIGWLRPAAEVGFYSAAQRIILLLYIIPGVLSTSIFPLLSRLASKDDKRTIRTVVESSLTSVFLVALPIMSGGIILAEPLTRLVFGPEYLPGTLSLQILLLTVPLNFAAIILSNLVFAYNEQKKLAIYAAIGGILNIILDLAFIPLWGIAGSSFATFCVQLVSMSYLWWVAKRIVPFELLPRIRKMVVASVLMCGGLVLLLPLHLKVLPLIGGGAIFYFAVLYFWREPLFDEARLIFGQVKEN